MRRVHSRITSVHLKRLLRTPTLGATQENAAMSQQEATPTDHVFRFGAFCLSVRKRLLVEGQQPTPIGSRALEILITLLERHGELVSKQELIARVWPTTVVVDGNLTAQMAVLRRTLRDGRDGNRFIISEPGRGYRFVAPVAEGEEVAFAAPSPTTREDERAMADAILQRGIQALEFARALVWQGNADMISHG
jgi:DNA-binding winged helix-turn-helix (wHTH) protein